MVLVDVILKYLLHFISNQSIGWLELLLVYLILKIWSWLGLKSLIVHHLRSTIVMLWTAFKRWGWFVRPPSIHRQLYLSWVVNKLVPIPANCTEAMIKKPNWLYARLFTEESSNQGTVSIYTSVPGDLQRAVCEHVRVLIKPPTVKLDHFLLTASHKRRTL